MGSNGSSKAEGSFEEMFYGKADELAVERDGEVVEHLACERIPLDYHGLVNRGEVCMGRTRNGDIWAAIGGGVSHTGPQGLFHSADGGRTWSSQPIDPTRDNKGLCAFTVLNDDAFLLEVAGGDRVHFFRSADLGGSWEPAGEIPAEPFDLIGEGFLSLTELTDGTILFPVWRSKEAPEGEKPGPWQEAFTHDVFRSADAGKTWAEPAPTFEGCCETHIIELQGGSLLAAFRYSGWFQPWHEDKVEAWGGARRPDNIGRIFKHVFLGDSEDKGPTWRNLRPLMTKDAKPVLVFGECHGQLVQLPDGRLVLVHDRRYPYENAEVIARVSHDEGKTWGPDAYHVSCGFGYPASVALEDGTIVTVTGNTTFDANGNPIGEPPVRAIRWRLPGRDLAER